MTRLTMATNNDKCCCCRSIIISSLLWVFLLLTLNAGYAAVHAQQEQQEQQCEPIPDSERTHQVNLVDTLSHTLEPQWTTPLQEGDLVPNVKFRTRTRVGGDDGSEFDWKDYETKDYMQGKRVVLFALPGAFTPTCSSTHLPGYEALYDAIIAQGIDEVYCLSVNDAFVMRQWGLDLGLSEDKTVGSLGFEKVKLIADGTLSFTRRMGMSIVWDTERGFGERSWRYSMVVNHGVIEKLFIEPNRVQNSGPDPFEVSDADTMLRYLKSDEAKKKSQAVNKIPAEFPELERYPAHELGHQWVAPLKKGDKVPNVEFQTRTRVGIDGSEFDWKVRTTDDYFANKRVVLFALPGAFTPTCSTSHLPEYEAAYDEIRKLGIDEVYCLSVNDAFVMRSWGLDLGLQEDKTVGSLGGFEKVKLIPDGAAHFTRGMGMSTIWISNRGFGERSWRYSMVVNNGVIEAMFSEEPHIPNIKDDPFEKSTAATMLEYLKSTTAAAANDKAKEEL